LNDDEQKRFKSLLPSLLKRIQVYTDLEHEFSWVFQNDFFCKDKSYQSKLQKNSIMLQEIGLKLKKCEWNIEIIKNCLNQYISENSLTFKDVGPVLRIALTGKTNSPDLVTIIYELGCTITVNRLNYKY
jgi:glutamyl/glutaminyl-tRNA synthetase